MKHCQFEHTAWAGFSRAILGLQSGWLPAGGLTAPLRPPRSDRPLRQLHFSLQWSPPPPHTFYPPLSTPLAHWLVIIMSGCCVDSETVAYRRIGRHRFITKSHFLLLLEFEEMFKNSTYLCFTFAILKNKRTQRSLYINAYYLIVE